MIISASSLTDLFLKHVCVRISLTQLPITEKQENGLYHIFYFMLSNYFTVQTSSKGQLEFENKEGRGSRAESSRRLRVTDLLPRVVHSPGDRSDRGQRRHSPLHSVGDLGRQDGECQDSGQQPRMRRLRGQTKDGLSDSSAQTVVEEVPSSVRGRRLTH